MLVLSIIINIAILLQVTIVQGRYKGSGRIINGIFVPLDEIPFQVSLQKKDRHSCGGTILNKNFVLTAAHCVAGVPLDILKVVAGTIHLKSLSDSSSTHNVSKIQIHDEYNSTDDWINDIALLKVDPPFVYSKHIAPAILPSKDEVYEDNTTAVVSGFGKTLNTTLSMDLLKVKVHIVNQGDCVARIPTNKVRPTNICANNFSEKQGYCRGDSGGPLSIDHKVIGIVSWSPNGGCAPVKKPQVYTRVTSYVDWINERINE